MNLILKLIKGVKITDIDLTVELYEICDREHSSCNTNCPVYDLNGGWAPDTIPIYNHGCDCFKNGAKMLKFIREKI